MAQKNIFVNIHFLVSINFDNYRKLHPGILEDDDETSSEDEFDLDEDDSPKPSGTTSTNLTSNN